MRTALRLILSGLVASSFFLTSCEKEYSDDTPLAPVYQSSIFVGNNDRLVYSIDKQSGKKNWEYHTEAEMSGAPLILQDGILIAQKNGTIVKLNKQNGTVLFHRALSLPINSTPILWNNNIYLGAANNIFQINPTNMDFVDTVTLSGNVSTSPVVGNIKGLEGNYIFATTSTSTVHAINLDDLVNVWSASPASNIGFESAPCLDGDSAIYIGGDDGKLYALNTNNGSVKWTFTTGGAIKSSPITAGGNILFGSFDKTFYSVDTRTGLVRWTFKTDERIYGSAAIHQQNVIFGGYDKNIYCIAIIDGELQWKQTTFGLIKASPVIVDDQVIITSYDKIMYNLDAKDGAQNWTRNLDFQADSKYAVDDITKQCYPATSGMYEFK